MEISKESEAGRFLFSLDETQSFPQVVRHLIVDAENHQVPSVKAELKVDGWRVALLIEKPEITEKESDNA